MDPDIGALSLERAEVLSMESLPRHIHRSSGSQSDSTKDEVIPPFRQAHARFMNESYSQVVDSGAVGFVKKYVHRMLERGHSKSVNTILELGAGQGQHLNFVQQPFLRYIQSDWIIRKELSELPRVENKKLNAEDLTEIESGSVDRVIATCLLTHLDNPEKALHEWRRVVAAGGWLSLWVPCEMGMLLRTAQSLTTKRKIEKNGFDYEWMCRLDHRNHFPMMRALIKQVFSKDHVHFSGVPFTKLPWDLQLLRVYQIQKRPNP